MTPAHLDRIDELAAEATQGPRVTSRMHSDDATNFHDEPDPDGDMVAGICDCGFDSKQPRADAAFIAALDTDTVRELVRLARIGLQSPAHPAEETK